MDSSWTKRECVASDDLLVSKRLCGGGGGKAIGDSLCYGEFSSSSLNNDPVFIFCIRGENKRHHWYGIDPDPKKLNQEQTVNPGFQMRNHGRALSSVAFGSKIYFVCDAHIRKSRPDDVDMIVKVYDTKTTEWTIPSFFFTICQRPKPAMVAHGGLIYIIGSRDYNKFFIGDPDMFEPTACIIEPPPDDQHQDGIGSWSIFISDEPAAVLANPEISCAIDDTYIVVVVSSKFAYVCPRMGGDSFWGPPIALNLPRELNPPGSRNILLLNGEIIMYVYPSLLAGSLDSLRRGHWEYTRVSGDFEDYTKSATPDGHVFLFDNGGGDFYFLWSPKPVPNECEDEPKTKVHCLRFHIAIPHGKYGWSTSVRETMVYTTDCAGGDLVDCVHML